MNDIEVFLYPTQQILDILESIKHTIGNIDRFRKQNNLYYKIDIDEKIQILADIYLEFFELLFTVEEYNKKIDDYLEKIKEERFEE